MMQFMDKLQCFSELRPISRPFFAHFDSHPRTKRSRARAHVSSESLLEHTNRIFRAACHHKRQDSPTSRQHLEKHTCRFRARLFPIINELVVHDASHKKTLFVREISRSSRESIKRNCFCNVAVRALYSSLTLMKTRIIQAYKFRYACTLPRKKSEIKAKTP